MWNFMGSDYSETKERRKKKWKRTDQEFENLWEVIIRKQRKAEGKNKNEENMEEMWKCSDVGSWKQKKEEIKENETEHIRKEEQRRKNAKRIYQEREKL